MKAEHLEILVEEPSMEAFLIEILPRLIGNRATYTIHVHQGKADLLSKLRARLRGYAKWLPENWRIVVLVDRDDNNCNDLKYRMDADAKIANLVTRAEARTNSWQVVNRIAIEELEAWFFGEWQAVVKAYPRVSALIVRSAPYRACDAIAGGTREALERVLRKAGYFKGGLRKLEVSRSVGQNFDIALSKSPSFLVFCSTVLEALNEHCVDS